MDIHHLFELAASALAHGDLVAAERGFLELLALQPNNAQIRHPLGVTLAQQGRTQEALEMIGAAAADRPDDTDILLDYGVVLREVGRFEEALNIVGHALTLRPGHSDLMLLKGDVLLSLDRAQEALACYDRAQGFRPGTAMALRRNASNPRRSAEHDKFS